MTGTQKKIIKRLISGWELHRPSGYGHTYYWFLGLKHHPGTVHERTLLNMKESGLLKIAADSPNGRTRYMPTDIAIFEVQKNEPSK